MPAGPPADLDVGGLVKGVAGDGHDVKVLSIFLEPALGDFAAVGDDGDGFEVQDFFAVLGEFAEEVGFEEGFAAGEVDFFHAGVFEEGEAFFGVGEGFDVGGLCGVLSRV